jgi:peptidoglycan/LPS O-acetylase OafA/YrhL
MRLKLKDYADTTFVTGMRAYAALAVVLIHAGGGGLRSLGALGNAVANLGLGGVTAFFVISGFSVASSYPRAGGYLRYLFLRFMRLAPLYYFWLLVYLLWLQRSGYWASYLGTVGLPIDVMLHLAFLHAFFVQTANSIMGVEWSLSVEMFWYLFLPALIGLSRVGRGFWLLALGLLGYSIVKVMNAHPSVAMQWQLAWNPLVYLLSFALGVWAFVLRATVPAAERKVGVRLALGLLCAYAGLNAFFGAYAIDTLLAVSVITFILLVYGSQEDVLCRVLFLSPVVLALGTLSYGIYLTHILALHFIEGRFGTSFLGALGAFLGVMMISAGLSWATYLMVELPMQRWARRFLSTVNKSAA